MYSTAVSRAPCKVDHLQFGPRLSGSDSSPKTTVAWGLGARGNVSIQAAARGRAAAGGDANLADAGARGQPSPRGAWFSAAPAPFATLKSAVGRASRIFIDLSADFLQTEQHSDRYQARKPSSQAMRDFALRRSPFLAPHPSPIRQSLGNPATVGGRSLPLLRIGSLCAKKAGRIGQLWPMCRALVQIANRGQNLFFSWLSSSPIAIPAHALPFLVRGVGKLGPPLSAGPSGTVLGTSCGGLKSHFFGPNCKCRFIVHMHVT